MTVPGILVPSGVFFLSTSLIASHYLSHLRADETFIIMHVCDIRDIFVVQSSSILTTRVLLCGELLHALENFGIFSSLLGISFDFISILILRWTRIPCPF